MEYSCVRQTALPHTTKLFEDFTYHPDRLGKFYPYLPLDLGSFRKIHDELEFGDTQRKNLIAALEVQNAGNPLLAKLAEPGTVAVVTGQQVGLFSGPLYTVYKALTAIRLAAQLTADGIPAVPIFWLATEDHDFAEVNQAWAFSACTPIKFEAAASPVADQPVGGVVLESVPLEELREALVGLPFADEALAMVRDCYKPGATFGEAFGALLDRLLAGFPILRVDPMLPEFRELAAPLISQAVLRSHELTAEILQRNKELTDAGYNAQVHVENSTALFFLLEDDRRIGLRRQNGDFLAGKQKHSADELAQNAHNLSPNALLRPVVQDSMIPTIAYVGGPAEIAYLAQSEVLYRSLLGRQPIAVHRAGFTLLDARSDKLLDRYHLELTDFFRGEEALREKAARTVVDPQLIANISTARAKAVDALHLMKAQLKRFDRSTTKALEKSWRKIEYQFDRIERKVNREALTRDERASRHVSLLACSLFPRHKLQERVFSTVALFAQYGPDLIPRLYEHVNLDCPDHQLLTL